MANTTLVNVDEQTAPKLVSFIASLIEEEGEGMGQSMLDKGNALIESGDTKGLIELILSHSERIISAEIESDTIGCFQAVISIMFSLTNERDSLAIVEKVVSCLTSDSASRARLRLKVLVSVFNMLVSPAYKVLVIKSTFRYGLSSGQAALISKFYEKVDYWISEWALGVEDSRELYQLISDLLSDASSEHALVYLVKYLDTYEGETYPSDLERRAIDAVISAIRSPVGCYRDRTKLYETLAKQKSLGADLGKLVELLRILCVDSLESYLAFQSANASLFSSHSLNTSEIERSMKLLTLCTLGATQKKLPYARVAEALQVAQDEVEMWVVDAISNKLMEASMDQFKSEVQVTKVANRSFDPAQWATVQTRLAELKKNMNAVVTTVRNNTA